MPLERLFIEINGRRIGSGNPTYIIAEVGSNHDRKLGQARELIDIASDSGADAVKFQIFSAEKLYSEKTPQFAVVKDNELPREWVGELAEYAKKRGIIFLATPFDKEAVERLYEIGVPAYKWASPEIMDLPLLKYAAAKKKPMLISTGMCDLADIQEAVDMVYSTGNEDIILLHCTSLYPTKPHHANLRMMDTMRDAFHLPVGLSDHTLGFIITEAAVARGACVIEKHLTLSRKLKGPDHPYALEPDELKQMVRAIREVEQSLGSPIKKLISGAEDPALNSKSITAKNDIPKGTRIIEDMITIKRSAYGIKPKFLDVVIGREAKRDIEKDEAITWEMV